MGYYKKWYISGDPHRDFKRFEELEDTEEIAVIILGDAAVNWTLDQNDRDFKTYLKKKYPNITWYLLRGNHEARPTAVYGMLEDWDDEVLGYVYYEPEFLNIRYFKDGGEYQIDGHTVLTIGGAYSVDKFYRLEMGYRWFEDEQLTPEEMRDIEELVKGKSYDFVFTHTCPFEWRPTDLFLPMINQGTVDNRMEIWLQDLKDTFKWDIWCFGHYHADRIERPHVEQFFEGIKELSTVWSQWHGGELHWWMRKSPNYYKEG